MRENWVMLLSCMHTVLCLFLLTEKLAYFKIWVALFSKYVVFLTSATRNIPDRKSHFKQAHFTRDFTPLPHRGSGTLGHIVIITKWKCTVAKLLLPKALSLSQAVKLFWDILDSHVACTWPKSSIVSDKIRQVSFTGHRSQVTGHRSEVTGHTQNTQ